MGDNIFFGIILNLIVVVLPWMWIGSLWHGIKENFSLSFSKMGGINLLGAGRKEDKPKEFDNKPMPQDPAAVNPANNAQGVGFGGGMPGGGDLSSMSGNFSVPIGPGFTTGSGGAGGTNITMGLANAVFQGPQSGNIKNIGNGKKIITAPIYQGGGHIYNNNTRIKGAIGQTSQSVLNQAKRFNINKLDTPENTIKAEKGKLSFQESTTANIYGDIKRGIKAPRGTINGRIESGVKVGNGVLYVGNITGVNKISSVMAQTLYGTKGTKHKIRRIHNAHNAGILTRITTNRISEIRENQAQNVKVTLQQANQDQKAVESAKAGEKYSLSSGSGYSLANYRKEIDRPELNDMKDQREKVAVFRLHSEYGSDINLSKKIVTRESSLRSATKSQRLSVKDLSEVEKLVSSRKQEIAANRDKRAHARADFTNSDREKQKKAVENIIQGSKTMQNNLHDYMSAAYPDIGNANKKKLEDARKQAIENIQKDKNIPESERKQKIQEIEEKYKDEMNNIENKEKAAEDYIMGQIAENPDGHISKQILGKDGQKKYKEAIENENDQVYFVEREKEEQEADDKFVKENPEYSDKDKIEIRQAREEQEVQQAIDEAIKMVLNEKEKKERRRRTQPAIAQNRAGEGDDDDTMKKEEGFSQRGIRFQENPLRGDSDSNQSSEGDKSSSQPA